MFKAISLNNRAWKIWRDLCPGLFWSSALVSLSAASHTYVTLWLSSRIITELAGEQDPHILIRLALTQLLFSAFSAFLSSLLNRLKQYYTDSAVCLYDRIYMDKMFSLDYHQADSHSTWEQYSRITQNDKWSDLGIHGTIRLFGQLSDGTAQILGGILFTVPLFLSRIPQGSSDYAFLERPLPAFLIWGLMLFTAAASPACAAKAQDYWTRYASETRFGNRLADFYISAGRDRKRALDMRIYCQQENISKIYLDRFNPFSLSSKIARQAKGPMGMWTALSRSISLLPTAAAYLFVCLKSRAGAFGLGHVTLYVGAVTNLFLGFSKLSETLGRMRANSSFLEQTYEFLDIPNTMYQGSLTTEKRSDRQYEIEFRDVSFRYPGAKNYVLKHINLKFPIGSRLAVVGMNGSGKTTFIKLLCRLYDPTEGEILLNGIDIRKYRYDDYIRLFSVVFQDFKLLSLPLGENLSGDCRYDPDRAADALKKAGFTDWERVMAQGLSTCLYKDLDLCGVELSGGEAQKTAIARALYKDAPFIILDEPTAALDPIAEAEIYEHFAAITGDRTAVCISHRLSSCRFCDRIAVFHEGSILQQGTHQQLLAQRSGKYYQLWEAQAQYYREEKQVFPEL